MGERGREKGKKKGRKEQNGKVKFDCAICEFCASVLLKKQFMCLCMCACMYVCAYVHLYTYPCVYVM